MLYILTLSFNGKDKLEKLYPTLINNLNNIKYKWLIKENGSSDNSNEYIESLNNENIHLIKYPHNRDNFSQGCNFLFNEVKTTDDDYILLLNNDIIFNDDNSIKNMISIIEKDNNVGVVGCKLTYPDQKTLQHTGVVFSDKTYRLPTNFRCKEAVDKTASEDREYQAITGAVMLTKAKYYNDICQTNKSGINGLDENYVFCFEDVDACLAIKYNMNKKIVYCGNTNVSHEESATLNKNPMNKLFMSHNMKYFTTKWFGKYSMDREDYIKNNKHKLYKVK